MISFLQKYQSGSPALPYANLREVIEDAISIWNEKRDIEQNPIILRYNDITPEAVYLDAKTLKAFICEVLGTRATNSAPHLTVISVSASASKKQRPVFTIDILQNALNANLAVSELGGDPHIIKRLAKDLGGKFKITQEALSYKVSSLRLSLRLAQTTARETRSINSLHSKKVLLIEPLVAFQKIISEQLAEWGMACDVASNVREGFAKQTTAVKTCEPYDVLLFNSYSPESESGRLLSVMRRTEALQSVQAVMMAPVSQVPSAAIISNWRLADIVTKPLRRETLRRAMTTAVTQPIYASLNVAPLTRHAIKHTPPVTTSSSVSTDMAARPPVKLLVAEDNDMNQKVLRALLTKQNVEISFASNGSEAVDQFKAQKFDVVLMDLSMPVMGGLDAAKHIRAFEARQKYTPTPIICVSAHAGEKDRKIALDAGMDDYLVKPIMTQPLLDILEKWSTICPINKLTSKAA